MLHQRLLNSRNAPTAEDILRELSELQDAVAELHLLVKGQPYVRPAREEKEQVPTEAHNHSLAHSHPLPSRGEDPVEEGPPIHVYIRDFSTTLEENGPASSTAHSHASSSD